MPYYYRDPKRDHNFDKHPYDTLRSSLYSLPSFQANQQVTTVRPQPDTTPKPLKPEKPPRPSKTLDPAGKQECAPSLIAFLKVIRNMPGHLAKSTVLKKDEATWSSTLVWENDTSICFHRTPMHLTKSFRGPLESLNLDHQKP